MDNLPKKPELTVGSSLKEKNLEQKATKPELLTELLTLINTIKWESGYVFAFNGTEFYIITSSMEELSAEDKKVHGEPAEIYPSTYVNGYDIYLHDTIPESDRKRVLFHEILEANLQHQGLSEKEAHIIALEEEEKVFGLRKNS